MGMRCGGGRKWCRDWGTSLTLALLLAVSGCGAGSGDDDDEGGDGGGGLQPTLQSIQVNIFTPACALSGCHVGATAPFTLQLDTLANSRMNLVGDDGMGVPSGQIPASLRVNPGFPDDSYIVQKIEGSAGIAGQQMPLNNPPLAAAQIALIREWIFNGAVD